MLPQRSIHDGDDDGNDDDDGDDDDADDDADLFLMQLNANCSSHTRRH